MRLFEFLLILTLAAAVAVCGWGWSKDHDARLAAESAVRAEMISRDSDSAAATKAQAACMQGSASGFRAGQLAARLAAPVARPANGPRQTISAAELAQEVQP